jgi:ACS family hexuronate transporter-like MFS transporter
MLTKPASFAEESVTFSAPQNTNVRWFVCALLFAATTINYMDRSVFSFIEPLLHNAPFMGWNFHADQFHQTVFDNNYGNVIIWFQIAYGVAFLIAGRVIDKLGTKVGYACAIGIWALSSMSHSLVSSVAGFCIARVFLGFGESGNFPAAIKATTEWFPVEERGKAVGIFNSGTCAAFFLAPKLIGFATGHYGWRAAFIATGSLGILWLIVWLSFPYNRLRRGSTQTQANLEADFASQTAYGGNIPLRALLQRPGTYAFAIGKGLTDGVWWFYLFYLPQFLNRNYGLDLIHAYWFIVTVYVVSTVGSIFGGSLSGWLMEHGYSINAGRKLAMLFMALLVLPLILVPHMGTLFPANPWPATLLIALAAAAHQGWSANLFSTPGDMFPSTAVSTIVGIGGAAGAVGGAYFTWIVKRNLSLHPLFVFSVAALAYIVSLAIFQLLVPRLGAKAQGLDAPQEA